MVVFMPLEVTIMDSWARETLKSGEYDLMVLSKCDIIGAFKTKSWSGSPVSIIKFLLIEK